VRTPVNSTLSLDLIGDGSTLFRKTSEQLEAVVGEHFTCRVVSDTDASTEVLVVISEELNLKKIRDALLAGVPPARMISISKKATKLEEICLKDLGVSLILVDSKGRFSQDVTAQVRQALGRIGEKPLSRSRIEETLGQLETQKTETFHGLAFKQRLADVEFNPPEKSGLDVSVIPGRNSGFPVFGSCVRGGTNTAILYGIEKGLKELNVREHALFTQALVCRCVTDDETETSIIERFIQDARLIVGLEESFRPTLLVLRRSVGVLEILLTGSLDLWIINPKRIPRIGVLRGPGRATRGIDFPDGKRRRIKLTGGDHLLLLSSDWFPENEVDSKTREDTMLLMAKIDELPDFVGLSAPADSGPALVMTFTESADGRVVR